MTTIWKLGAATAAAALICSFTGAAFAGEIVSRPHGNDRVELFVAAGSAAYGDVDYYRPSSPWLGQANTLEENQYPPVVIIPIGPQVKEETAIAVGGALVGIEAKGNTATDINARWDAQSRANDETSEPLGNVSTTQSSSQPSGPSGSSGCGCNGASARASGSLSVSVSTGGGAGGGNGNYED